MQHAHAITDDTAKEPEKDSNLPANNSNVQGNNGDLTNAIRARKSANPRANRANAEPIKGNTRTVKDHTRAITARVKAGRASAKPDTAAAVSNQFSKDEPAVARNNQPRRKAAASLDSKIEALLHFDHTMTRKWLQNPEAVLVGTDEVGRGCLAGPVVAAALIFPPIKPGSELARALARLDDSKKLSPRVREELAELIKQHARYEIAQASVEEIDEFNILQASFLAMRRAIAALNLAESSVVLVDGNRKIPQLPQKQVLIVGGDGTSASIAASSVLAKVHRDGLMVRLHREQPQFCWDSNKGYGSKAHCNAIVEHGLTEHHRRSFCTKIMQHV